MTKDSALAAILNPNLSTEFAAWFIDGKTFLAGNPKTCTELRNLEHFWIGNSELCACGKMRWMQGDDEPEAAE